MAVLICPKYKRIDTFEHFVFIRPIDFDGACGQCSAINFNTCRLIDASFSKNKFFLLIAFASSLCLAKPYSLLFFSASVCLKLYKAFGQGCLVFALYIVRRKASCRPSCRLCSVAVKWLDHSTVISLCR